MGLSELEPWDTAYVSESLRRARFDIDDEVVRPYFPLDRVLDGMFAVVHRVFGLVVREEKIPEVWHPDVRYYELVREDDALVAHLAERGFPDSVSGRHVKDTTPAEAVTRAAGFWQALGANVTTMTPAEHDAALAAAVLARRVTPSPSS